MAKSAEEKEQFVEQILSSDKKKEKARAKQKKKLKKKNYAVKQKKVLTQTQWNFIFVGVFAITLIIGMLIGWGVSNAIPERESKFMLNGQEIVSINVGDEYTDQGALLLENGVDRSSLLTIVVKNSAGQEVTLEDIGLVKDSYVITYTIFNGGYQTSSLSRIVYVGGQE